MTVFADVNLKNPTTGFLNGRESKGIDCLCQSVRKLSETKPCSSPPWAISSDFCSADSFGRASDVASMPTRQTLRHQPPASIAIPPTSILSAGERPHGHPFHLVGMHDRRVRQQRAERVELKSPFTSQSVQQRVCL
jgi:hypothetical protein